MPIWPSIDDLALWVDENKIRSLQHADCKSEWIHPEVIRHHGIAQRDVPGDAFIEAKFGKETESEHKAGFQVRSLFVLISEYRWSRHF